MRSIPYYSTEERVPTTSIGASLRDSMQILEPIANELWEELQAGVTKAYHINPSDFQRGGEFDFAKVHGSAFASHPSGPLFREFLYQMTLLADSDFAFEEIFPEVPRVINDFFEKLHRVFEIHNTLCAIRKACQMASQFDNMARCLNWQDQA